MKQELWYESPAVYWPEALPLGNGRIGAMVFGGAADARLALNEDTLWSGYAHDPNEAGRAEVYRKARELVHAKQHLAAQNCLEDGFTGEFSQAYMPLGDLLLHFEIPTDKVTGYRRCLDLPTATHTVSFDADDCHVRRTCWISQPHQVLVLHIESSRPVSFTGRLSSQLHYSITAQDGEYLLDGQCPGQASAEGFHKNEPIRYDPAHPGIRFRAAARVCSDGTVTCENDEIRVQNASDTLLLLAVRSNFTHWDEPATGEGYREQVQQDLDAAANAGLAALYQAHLSEFRAYYDRVTLELPETANSALPTDRRQLAFQSEPDDQALIALLFHFGRYLMISASRPGTQPTNLQGIWSEQLVPPWSSNYTLNINTEMNYWPALPCGLSELQEPLERLVSELAVAGQRTAAAYYGARGFVAHHNTDLWRLSNPVGMRRRNGAKHDYWPMAGGWLCRHLFDHYLYTMDKTFLKEQAYPVMKQAALFFLDVLSEDSDGYLSFSPATSPENRFWENGEKLGVCEDTAMNASIIRELFQNCVTACRELDEDAALAEQLELVLPKLRPLTVGSDGRLLEWDSDYPETEPEHRHTSHLYGLYPGTEITPEKTPQLAEACRRTLDARGLECTGWSLAWKTCLWARLRDGEKALQALQYQLRPAQAAENKTSHTGGGSYASLLCACPPFQIDGNFGAAAGIAEILVQCDGSTLELLPALPAEWHCGRASGLRTRGGVCVDMEWDGGVLKRAVLMPDCAGEITVRWPGGELHWTAQPGIPVTIRP